LKKIVLKEKKVSDDFLIASFEFENPFNDNTQDFIKPGQFLMLKNRTEPILAKPFSVLNTNRNGFKMLIKIIGRFTDYLSNAVPGETFLYRGPYGTAFEKKLDLSKKIITIGGGCGAAPILFFNEHYFENIEKTIIGFKNDSIRNLINIDEAVYESLSGKTVIDELNEYLLLRNKVGKPIVLACGSSSMCQELHKHSHSTTHSFINYLSHLMKEWVVEWECAKGVL
jgi:dihydroorotate dehydrogenase electron transfer subunit